MPRRGPPGDRLGGNTSKLGGAMRGNWDLLIYILIGAAVAFGAYWAAVDNVSDQSLVKWGGLALNTSVLFGYAIKQYWRFRRSTVFWEFIGTLLIIHTLIFYLILRNVHQWRLAWFLS
jgi:hypothetical protein